MCVGVQSAHVTTVFSTSANNHKHPTLPIRTALVVARRRPSLEPVIVGVRRGEKDQAELAYLDFVAVGQDCRLHRLTVDVGAVEAADVDDLKFAVLSPEFGVPAADGDVIAEDVAVGVSAGGRKPADPARTAIPRSGRA
jgi:hypothetical protein